MGIVDSLKQEARDASASGIQEVIEYGRSKPDLIALWSGEGDLATPPFITDAAVKGLADGETFYTWQNGIPKLREALARYNSRHFGRAFKPEEFIVTTGGMHAITLAIRAILGPNDEVIYLTPAWPNFAGAARVAGAVAVSVSLQEGGHGWSCEIDRIEAAITVRTRAIFVNSPSNPTGWTASIEDLRRLLDLSRRFGLWIIADEIYAMFSFNEGRAPSFYDVMEPEDRVLCVNTFSKNWSMTGWRIGWLHAHPALSQIITNLVSYSTSGVPQFLQRGATAALDDGDWYVSEQVNRARKSRDVLCSILGEAEGVRLAVPAGAFYLFFSIEGMRDSRRAAFELIDMADVGLAPGNAFGKAGEGYLRLCFQRDATKIEDAAARIVRWAASRRQFPADRA